MQTKKLVIIGCGYGGAVSAWRASGSRRKLDVSVIDRGRNFNFLPLLPDCLGRGLPAGALAYPIKNLSSLYGFNFINEEVKSVDLKQRFVFTSGSRLGYDYLIIASGSETNFYGNPAIRRYSYKLDDAQDAQKIRSVLEERRFDCYIIAGGGYTGIEIATNLRMFLRKARIKRRIIIVERAGSILWFLPEYVREYVSENLRRLDIEVFANTMVERVEEGRVFLSNKDEFNNSMLIWAAGVRTADFIQNLDLPKNPQGRLVVDEYLRASDSCFVIGDAAWFYHKKNYLRMAVQFAVAQAAVVCYNMTSSIKGSRLRKYKPLDLGQVIPMANNRSCGNVLGVNVKGMAATLCHYSMALYRAYGFKNKSTIIKALSHSL